MTVQGVPNPPDGTRLLVENCHVLACFDDEERELRGVDILVEGPRVADIGENLRARHGLGPETPAIDASRFAVLPGFVNVHHHMWQVLTRVTPRIQNAELFEWLVENYQVWERVDPEAVHIGALLSMAELLLSGCTTSSDHHYLFPEDAPVELVDEEIRAARELGLRFHPTRGSMTLGVDDGGLPPMSLVETPDRVLADYDRVIGAYHDTGDYAMTRIALAPCAPFNATEDVFRETATIARQHGVLIHTHLAETAAEDVYCQEHFGCRPLEYVARFGWEGPDVWFAHCVKLDADEVRRLAETGTGVAHCPGANARLGSGVAPVPAMLDAGVRVGLGVDGSSSNDSGNILTETRLAFMFHRATSGVASYSTRDALRVATRGGADVLRNPKIGRIEVGSAADIIMFDLDQYQYAGGASSDPLGALVLCGGNFTVHTSVINGRVVVEDGQLCGQVETAIVRRANEVTGALLDKVKTKRRIDYSVLVDWDGGREVGPSKKGRRVRS